MGGEEHEPREGGFYFLEFVLLSDFVFACFGGLSVQLLCCELGKFLSVKEPISSVEAKMSTESHTLRLKRDFSRPDIVG